MRVSRRNSWLSVLLAAAVLLGILAWPGGHGPSTCYGTPAKGRLEDGVAMTVQGANFQPYSYLGVALHRTYVHSTVKHVIEQSYRALYRLDPELRFRYGESGWPHGGPFKPHRTHRNGTAVDFMVPVRDRQGRVVLLPTLPWQKFGYGIDFDAQGNYQDLHIDFEAMALHLQTLLETARAEGADIDQVIFDPRLQPYLFATPNGAYLRSQLRFNERPAWVRHDDHYHVVFRIRCRPL